MSNSFDKQFRGAALCIPNKAIVIPPEAHSDLGIKATVPYLSFDHTTNNKMMSRQNDNKPTWHEQHVMTIRYSLFMFQAAAK